MREILDRLSEIVGDKAPVLWDIMLQSGDGGIWFQNNSMEWATLRGDVGEVWIDGDHWVVENLPPGYR